MKVQFAISSVVALNDEPLDFTEMALTGYDFESAHLKFTRLDEKTTQTVATWYHPEIITLNDARGRLADLKVILAKAGCLASYGMRGGKIVSLHYRNTSVTIMATSSVKRRLREHGA